MSGMISPQQIEIGAGVIGVIILALLAWKLIRRWRRKSPEEIERLRRLGVNACGRMIAGRIVELAEHTAGGPSGPVLLYDYEVAGVTYEAAQDISALPDLAAAAPFLPGQPTTVKYDPRQPTNSIIACEAWSGIPGVGPNERPTPAKAPAETSPQAAIGNPPKKR
jgi:hypothetical protein